MYLERSQAEASRALSTRGAALPGELIAFSTLRHIRGASTTCAPTLLFSSFLLFFPPSYAIRKGDATRETLNSAGRKWVNGQPYVRASDAD